MYKKCIKKVITIPLKIVLTRITGDSLQDYPSKEKRENVEITALSRFLYVFEIKMKM